MKKSDHVVIRNENLFCLNCGSKQGISYPIEIPVFAAMGAAFSKSHASCPKTWREPTPDETESEYENQRRWLEQGEHGTSSKAIYSVLSGKDISKNGNMSHPLDPSDFRRCYLLLKFVPSWRSRINEMGLVSPVWAALSENWDKLTEMLEEQMKTGKPNGMYEFMEKLGC